MLVVYDQKNEENGSLERFQLNLDSGQNLSLRRDDGLSGKSCWERKRGKKIPRKLLGKKMVKKWLLHVLLSHLASFNPSSGLEGERPV